MNSYENVFYRLENYLENHDIKNKIMCKPHIIHENPYNYNLKVKQFGKEQKESICFGKYIERLPLAIASTGPGPHPNELQIWATTEKPDLDISELLTGDFSLIGEVRYYKEVEINHFGFVNITNKQWKEYLKIWRKYFWKTNKIEKTKSEIKYIGELIQKINVKIEIVK